MADIAIRKPCVAWHNMTLLHSGTSCWLSKVVVIISDSEQVAQRQSYNLTILNLRKSQNHTQFTQFTQPHKPDRASSHCFSVFSFLCFWFELWIVNCHCSFRVSSFELFRVSVLCHARSRLFTFRLFSFLYFFLSCYFCCVLRFCVFCDFAILRFL